MSRDPSLEVQAAVIAALRAAGPVAALVGARVYDRAPQSVVFPHVSLGPMLAAPAVETLAGEGWELSVQVDVWSRGADGRVEALRICRAVGDALHDVALSISGAVVVMLRLTSQRIIGDGDMVTTHGVMDFVITTDLP
jgi:hypothetical protein